MPSSSASMLRHRSKVEPDPTKTLQRHADQQRRALGLPSSLSCAPSAFPGEFSSGYNVTIEFDYELEVTNPNEPVVEVTSQDIPFLEYAILQLLAQTINIRPCDLPAQSLGSNSNATITGLSSTSPDAVDDSVRKCFVLLLGLLMLLLCRLIILVRCVP